jgi:S-formylglutathione hydrolase FrmB
MKSLTLLILVFAFAGVTSAQVSHGVVKEGLTIDSKILGTKVRYTMYLPFDYESSNRFYPVVYLLHGYTDNDMGWIQFGEANLIADEAIAKRDIPSMIIAMPDGGSSWYINNYDGSVRYEDFFIREFIPSIESQYRIRAEKRYRGIAGLSMGGFGSLVHSMRHPDMFAACAALSAGLHTRDEFITMDERTWNTGWQIKVYGPGTGEARITRHLLSYDPVHTVETADTDEIAKLRGVRIYLDCGDDDYLTIGNSMLHIALTRKHIPHEFRMRDGAHTWTYWRTGLVDALKFIGVSFHQQ